MQKGDLIRAHTLPGMEEMAGAAQAGPPVLGIESDDEDVFEDVYSTGRDRSFSSAGNTDYMSAGAASAYH